MFIDAGDRLDGTSHQPVLMVRIGPPTKGGAGQAEPTAAQEAPRRLAPDFDVRLSRDPLTENSLAAVQVLWIACLNDRVKPPAPAPISKSEIEVLLRFVESGGGILLFTAAAEAQNHDQAHLNQFLRRFGVSVNPVNIGPKKQKIPVTCPLIGGLQWVALSLHTMDISENSPLSPPVLVMNDLQEKPARAGVQDYAGLVMIWGEYGKGRLAIVADGDWISASPTNTIGIPPALLKKHDNWEIMQRLSLWLARLKAAPTSHSDTNGLPLEAP